MSQVLAANPATNKRPFDSMMSIDGVPSPATAPCTPHRIHFLAPPPAGKRYRPEVGGGVPAVGLSRPASYGRPSSGGASSSDDAPPTAGGGGMAAGGGDSAAAGAGRRYLSGTRRLRRPPGAMQESDGSSSDTSSAAAAAAAKAGVAGGGAGTPACAARGGHRGVGGGVKATSAAATTGTATAVPPAASRGVAADGGTAVAAVAGQVVLPEPPRGTVYMPVAKRLRKAVTAAMAAGERLYTSAEVSAAVAEAVATAEADVRSQAEVLMSERLAEQWHSFNRFSQDAVARHYAGKELSYLS